MVICCSSDKAAKTVDFCVAKTIFVEKEKEAVFSRIEVMLLSLHCWKSRLVVLEKRRIAYNKRNILLLPNVWVQYRFFFVLWVSHLDAVFKLVNLYYLFRRFIWFLVDLKANKLPPKKRPSNERVNKSGSSPNIDYIGDFLLHMNGQPKQIVDPRWYSRTQICDRAVPLEVKDVLH